MLAGIAFSVAVGRAARAEDVKRICVNASTAGQMQRDEGKLLDAREQLLRCAREDCPAVVKSSCAEWLTDIEAQIPSIVVRVLDTSGNDRTDLRASVDGKQLKLDGKPAPLDPGEHVIAVDTPEGARKEQKVLVVVREKSRLITLQIAARPLSDSAIAPSPESSEPPARPEPARIPLGAFVVGGVGVIALGSALYFGLAAKSDYDRLDRECAPRCNPDDTQAARRKAVVSDVSLGIGVAGVVGGVAWAILGSRRSSAAPTATTRLDIQPLADGCFATLSSSY
jgi:hypothetical protein